MKCPHCNFVSFEYLDSCKKCAKDLTGHKSQVGIDFPEPHFFDILTFVESAVSPPPVSDSANPFETDDFSVSGESDSIEIEVEQNGEAVSVADEEIDESVEVKIEEEDDDEISISLDDDEISEDSGLGLSIGDDESSQTLPGIDDLPGLDETGFANVEEPAANDEIEIDLGDAGSEIEVSLDDEVVVTNEVTEELDLSVKDISEEDISIDLDDFSDEVEAVSIEDFDLDVSDEGIELALDESKADLTDDLAGSIDDSAESLDLGDLGEDDEGSVSDVDIEALSAHADDMVDDVADFAEALSDDIDDLEISIGDETLPGLDDFDEDIDLGDLELPDDLDKQKD